MTTRRRRAGLSIVIALVLAFLVQQSGCAVRTPAAGERLGSSRSFTSRIFWPDRRTDDLEELAAASPEVIHYERRMMMEIDGEAKRVVAKSPRFEVLEVGVYGCGILRAVERVRPRPGDSNLPLLQFLSYPPGDEPAEALPGLVAFTAGEATRSIARRVYIEQLPNTSSLPRGVVVHIKSAGGKRFEAGMIESLRARGWFILSLSFPITLIDFSDIREQCGTDTCRTPDAQLRAWLTATDEAAHELDQLLADRAYAVEAALDYLDEAQPQLRSLPVVGIGASAGSLALPAVIARQPERFSAAVFIAGGANLMQIAQQSSQFDGGMRLTGVSDQVLGRVSRQYLEVSSLDPYHTAPALRSMPVLQLHGLFDAIVPAPTGDLLYERLGRPERWSFFGGHGLVFWLLPDYAERIAAWVDRQVELGARREMASKHATPAMLSK